MADLVPKNMDSQETKHTTKISEKDVEDIVRQISDKFDPEKIILFGSFAYGEVNSSSDVDMLIVMETAIKETEQAVAICQGIEYHFDLDLIVRTPATLSKRLALGDPFLYDIVHHGKVLYERAGA